MEAVRGGNMDIRKIRRKWNFRELGGCLTEDGREVKSGLFYRTGALGDLNEAELEIVQSLGIRHIFDLRSDTEIAVKPDPEISGAEYHPIGAIEEDASVNGLRRYMQSNTRAGHLKYLYGILPFCSAYRQIFEYLKNGETPILFHCSAGKDRTGVLAYLILRVLGCSHETAAENYMLSNRYRAAEIRRYLDEVADIIDTNPKIAREIRALAGASRENIEYSLECILKHNGSFEKYCSDTLNLSEEDIQNMRQMYTEEAKG